MTLLYKALAETGGTFTVVFVGGASILLSEKQILPSFFIPFVWGLIVCLMIIAVGHISGAHFNPAVTLAFAVAKRIPAGEILLYWTSQLAGGFAAVRLLGVLNR